MEEQFTPGPWKRGINKTPWGKRIKVSQCRIESENGIAVAQAMHIKNKKERTANSALISAAPELYYALKNLKECLEIFFGKSEKDFLKDCDNGELYFAREYNEACNALKKARGEK